MSTRVSICIPTYNRAVLLSQLLESIACEARPEDVEIAISDNASTDDTLAVVEAFKARWPSLVYYRSPVNAGPDCNYLKCVEISRSPFCWLMGSDDCVARGGLAKVLAWIENGTQDLLLAARHNCAFDMVPNEVEQWLGLDCTHYFDFTDEKQFLGYMGLALSLGAVFSYLSSIVVRRSCWDSFPVPDYYIGSAYSHVFPLLKIAANSGVYYCPQPLVLNRTGNDFFAKDGEARRILLDLNGYLMLADDLYPNGLRREAFLGLLRRAHRPLRTVVALRSRLDGVKWAVASKALVRCGYPRALISAVGPFGGPLRATLSAKHALRRAVR